MIANRMPTALRRAGAVAGLLALVASLVVASDLFGVRESLLGSATPPPRPSAFSRVNGAPAIETEKTVLRSQPWWQSVSRLQGAGTQRTRAFTIRGDAIQWRVKGSCQTGRLVPRGVDPTRYRSVVIWCPLITSAYAAATLEPVG